MAAEEMAKIRFHLKKHHQSPSPPQYVVDISLQRDEIKKMGANDAAAMLTGLAKLLETEVALDILVIRHHHVKGLLLSQIMKVCYV